MCHGRDASVAGVKRESGIRPSSGVHIVGIEASLSELVPRGLVILDGTVGVVRFLPLGVRLVTVGG